jgi:hypothetical protein
MSTLEVIHAAAAVAAKHAGGMGIVHHHHGPILLGQRAQLIDWTDVTVHRKNAVRDDQLSSWLILHLLQQMLCVGDVLVPEDLYLRTREARAINDAGVVQFIRDNEILAPEHGRDCTCIGREARLKDDAGFDILEARNLLFQLHVDSHCAGDCPDSARAHAKLLRCSDRRFLKFRMIREPKVVIRRQVDDALAVIRADGSLLVVQYPELEEGASRAKAVELFRQVSQAIATESLSHVIILSDAMLCSHNISTSIEQPWPFTKAIQRAP